MVMYVRLQTHWLAVEVDDRLVTYQVDLRLMTHVASYLGRGIDCFLQCSHTVNIVATQAVNEGLDWLKGTLMKNKVALKDVYYTHG